MLRTLGPRSGLRAPAVLWIPGLLAVALTLLPAWYLLERSTEGGWSAWEETLSRSAGELLVNSLGLAAVVSISAAAVAVPAAWLTVRCELPGRRLWAVALALPLAIPSYVMGLTVVAALGPRGMLQDWLEPFGVDRLPEVYGFWGAAFTLSAVTFPYVFLVVSGAMRALDPSVEEASQSLGKTRWETFFRVTLPLLAPALAAGLLLVALYTLSDFGGVATLRYETFTRAIFIEYQTSFDRTAAAILGVALAAVAMVVLAAELIVRARSVERLRARRIAPPAPIALGRWKWPAIAFLALVVAMTLAMPVFVLVYWLVKGIRAGTDFPELWEPLRHTVLLGGGGALVTVALALPLAVLSTRYGGAASRVLEQATFVTHALPGLVVALSLVFFGIAYARDLYQTVWMLLLAYVILFLPNALSALRAPLLRQSRQLEEAGAALGRGPLRVLASVTLPIARPGILVALPLVFLTVVKELPATLLLSPPGYRTLPGIVWSLNSDATLGAAALPALILVALAAVPVATLAWWGGLGEGDA
jgi:iron(III) transport system permease protein